MKKTVNCLLNMVGLVVLSIICIFINISYNKCDSMWLFLFGACIYLFFSILIYKKICSVEIKKKKLVIFLIFLFITIEQIICGTLLQSRPIWDFPVIQSFAKDFNNEYIWGHEYLSQYPNNLLLFSIFRIMYKIANFFGFYQYDLIGTVFNIICIDLAGLFTFLSIKKSTDSFNKGVYALGWFATISPIYIYTCIFYTDTLSMLFAPLILYVFLILKEQKNIKKIILYSVILGIIAAVGMLLKMTVIIVLLATLSVWIIFSKLSIKKMISITFILIMIGFILICKNIVVKNFYYGYSKFETNEIPYTHWIMMGLKGNGGYNEEDVQYTQSFSTKEEKINANVSQIKIRLKNLIETKNYNFFVDKLLYTWGDGTYFCLNKVVYKYGNIEETLINKQNNSYIKKYISVSQIRHISMLILILLSFANFTMKDDKENITTISKVTIVGIIVFFIIWEARSRYLVNFIPIFIISAINGMDNILYVYQKWKKRNIKFLKSAEK